MKEREATSILSHPPFEVPRVSNPMDGFVLDDLVEHRRGRVSVESLELETSAVQQGLEEVGYFHLPLGPLGMLLEPLEQLAPCVDQRREPRRRSVETGFEEGRPGGRDRV
jgi:hypothetical protein